MNPWLWVAAGLGVLLLWARRAQQVAAQPMGVLDPSARAMTPLLTLPPTALGPNSQGYMMGMGPLAVPGTAQSSMSNASLAPAVYFVTQQPVPLQSRVALGAFAVGTLGAGIQRSAGQAQAAAYSDKLPPVGGVPAFTRLTAPNWPSPAQTRAQMAGVTPLTSFAPPS